MNHASPEGQTLAGSGRLVDYSNLVKLPHTVFAMPFAVVGAVLASYHFPISIADAGWILLAFTSARFAAMGFNRIVDRRIDALNPRTRMREIPSGRLTTRQAAVAVLVASGLFLLSAGMLNRLCLILAPFALAWVFFYSYTKRFTSWAHLVLGFSLAIAPVGAYLAISGGWGDAAPGLITLAGGVLCWVAGFDILYSLQDEDFDRVHGLKSVPAAFGARGAIAISRTLHLLCVACFVATGIFFPQLGLLYMLGVGICAAMLIYEQSLVRPDDLSKIDAAFFNVNGVISVVLAALVLVERLIA